MIHGLIPDEFHRSLDRLLGLLDSAPGSVTTGAPDGGELTWNICPPAELGSLQIGYRVGPDGEDFTVGDDAWPSSWLVIAQDDLIGDPLIVDLARDTLPVLTAAHGEGTWEGVAVAPSLERLLTSA